MFNTPNFKRMMALIDEVFATRKDPDQLQVSEKDRKKLERLHPSSLSQLGDKNGPQVWLLMIPTTIQLMNDFLEGRISEQALLDNTPIGIKYEAIYLCSATTLPEFRGKGLTKKLALEAINAIRETNPVKILFVWPFTKEGNVLADSLAESTGLELLKKEHDE